MKKSNRIRKNYRLPSNLVRWMKAYARKKKLSETDVVEQAIASLKSVEEARA